MRDIVRFVFDAISFEEMTLSDDFENCSFIFASGYEERARHQASSLFKILGSRLKDSSIVLGFAQYRDAGSRAENDRFYIESINEPTIACGRGFDELKSVLSFYFDGLPRRRKIIVDYSSMPRVWYAMLFEFLCQKDYADEIIYFYSRGHYEQIVEYPTVGYSKVSIVSGSPRINAGVETYVLGIGLDFRRSYGIWHLIDPARAIIAYGVTSDNAAIIDRVLEQNREIQSWSIGDLPLDLERFQHAIGSLVSTVRFNLSKGDVILVADGPKPLVLAFSVAPLVFGEPGCVAVHVGSVKPPSYDVVNVKAAGPIYGFSVKVVRRKDVGG
jgi:hypothetical protein